MDTIAEKVESMLPTLKRIAQHFANDRTSADDLLQSICERILKTCKPEDTRSYICTQATWHAKNMVKADNIYMTYVGVIADGADDEEDILPIEALFDSEDRTPEDRLIELETAHEVQKLIDKLPETDTKIVKMLMVGFTREQIADELGYTYQAVKKRIQRIAPVFRAAQFMPA